MVHRRITRQSLVVTTTAMPAMLLAPRPPTRSLPLRKWLLSKLRQFRCRNLSLSSSWSAKIIQRWHSVIMTHDTADPIHKIRPRTNRTAVHVQPCHVSRNGRHGNQRKVTWQKVTKEWKTGDKYDKDNEKLTMVKTWQQMGKKGVRYSTVS